MQQPVSLQDTLARMLGNELAYMNDLELGLFEQDAVRDALGLEDGNKPDSGLARSELEVNDAILALNRYYSVIVGISRSAGYRADEASSGPNGLVESNQSGADMFIAARVGSRSYRLLFVATRLEVGTRLANCA